MKNTMLWFINLLQYFLQFVLQSAAKKQFIEALTLTKLQMS